MNIFGVAILVCLFQCAQVSLAEECDCSTGDPCKGYSVVVKDENIVHGSNNKVFVMPGVTATITPDCKLSLNICFNVTAGFDSAKLDYEIVKIIKIAGETGKDVGEGLKELGIDYCPYPIKEPGVFCSKPDKHIDLCRFSKMMSLAVGDVNGSVSVFYNNLKKGDNFRVKVTIKRTK